MNFYCVALKESSPSGSCLLSDFKGTEWKTQSNDELFRQFHLVQKPLQRHRAKQFNCYCLTEKNPHSLLVSWTKFIWEQNETSTIEKLRGNQKKKYRVRIYSRHWVKQYNCYCLSEKNITACSCLWLDGQFK